MFNINNATNTILAAVALIGGTGSLAWCAANQPSLTQQDIVLAQATASATRSALITQKGYCWLKMPKTLGNVMTQAEESMGSFKRRMADKQYKETMRVSFKYLGMKFTEQGVVMFKYVPDEHNQTSDRMVIPYCKMSVQQLKS